MGWFAVVALCAGSWCLGVCMGYSSLKHVLKREGYLVTQNDTLPLGKGRYQVSEMLSLPQANNE